MKRYLVELEAGEREALAAMTRKGSHRSQKVINALVLLNCDEGEFNERRTTGGAIAGVLRISARRVDRVKKRFVEDGLEAALGGRQGRRAKYLRKADGEFEARLVALSCGDPPEGRAQWSLRLLADRAVELGYIDSVSHETVRRVPKKNAIKPWRRVGWVIPPQRNADFAAGMERVLDVYRRPYDAKPRSTGNSPPTTPVSSSSASIRRVMCDMTLAIWRTSPRLFDAPEGGRIG